MARLRIRRRLALVTLGAVALAGCISGSDDDVSAGGVDADAVTTTASGGTEATSDPAPDETSDSDISAAGSAACSGPQVGRTDTERSFDDGTGARPYRLVVPESDGSAPAPLIVNLHGMSSTAEQQAAVSQLETNGAARGYVVVTPNGVRSPEARGSGQFWNISMDDNTDVAYIEALIDEVAAEVCIDESAVFATGMSNGGGMSAVLGCLSDRFAAVVPVAGINLNSGCRPDAPLTMVALHGDADIVVRYDADITVPEAAATYADAAGCDPEPVTESLFDDVELTTWAGCDDATVALYTVVGGGHTWPGRDLLAAAGSDADVAERQDMAVAELSEILGHMTTNIDAGTIALDVFDAERARVAVDGAGDLPPSEG